MIIKNNNTIKNKIIYNYAWCMVFVKIFVKNISTETCAILCD